MAKAFSIARALDRDHTKIVEGHLDADDWIGNTLIDPKSVRFNTGFTDCNGNEIFEGDQVNFAALNGIVAFDEDYGGFTFTARFSRRDAADCRIITNALKVKLEEKNNE